MIQFCQDCFVFVTPAVKFSSRLEVKILSYFLISFLLLGVLAAVGYNINYINPIDKLIRDYRGAQRDIKMLKILFLFLINYKIDFDLTAGFSAFTNDNAVPSSAQSRDPSSSPSAAPTSSIKTSTLDYDGERYLSSIINCVIPRLCYHSMLWISNG